MISYMSTTVVARADCCSDAGGIDFPPFKYGFCYEGSAGACCAPARGFELVMTWPQWRYVRDHMRLSWEDGLRSFYGRELMKRGMSVGS